MSRTMTREEAVELLTRIKNYKRLTLYEWLEIEKEALNMAIEALEHDKKEIINTKSVFNLSEDLISRQAAIDAVGKAMPQLTTPDGCGEFDHEIQIADEAFWDCMKIINDLPSAQPDVPDTNVGDIISRQAAIRWVKTECNPYGNPTLDFKSGKKVIEHLKQMPTAQPFTTEQIQTMQELESAQVEKAYELGKADRPKWIPCSERLPECEQEVLICTEKKLVGKDAYIDSIITPAIYEDGTMLEVESMWHWDDIDFDEWDDTEDCGIIPMGWFENRHFNPDEVYNNPVDRKVVAWMPLPEPYRERSEE